ncbi:hypothetical protein [Leifsonia sp. WHRI 6310E]|uniref:hypothetical protein n=1 Tax=Leifsonia sp. WHRI 6310E TaxID=3162562 RepID=UPI0032EB7010
MTGSRVQEAGELVATIRAALDAAGLPDVIATVDAGKVASGARTGIVLVAPPAITFPTWDATEATWSLHVVAGSMTNFLAAWQRIDIIIDALAGAQTLNLDEAEPSRFATVQGPQTVELPAYTITLNP